MPTPIHHHLSALIAPSRLPTTFLFIGPSYAANRPRFDLLLPVALAPPVAAALVGLSVCVGSICGGLYAMYMGFRGEPSKRYRSRRRTLWYGSVYTVYLCWGGEGFVSVCAWERRGLGLALGYHEVFALVVARVDGVLVGTGGGQELAAVDGEGRQLERAVGRLGVGAVLPLHDA